MNRGQSNVVGVAVLIGITVVSMGALTVAVGVIVDSNASEADAQRVAADLDDAIEPVGASGPQRGEVRFTDGEIRPVERHVEIRADGAVVDRLRTDALVFESDEKRVAFHSGAIVRETGETAWFEADPPITAGDDVLIVGVAVLGETPGRVSGTGGVRTTLETDVSHDRRNLGEAEFSVAIETVAPAAWERSFLNSGATVRRESASVGDLTTVVATFEGDRQGYLVVHDLSLEVGGRG